MKKILFAMVLLISCTGTPEKKGQPQDNTQNSKQVMLQDSIEQPQPQDQPHRLSKTAQSMAAQGLVNIHDVDSTIEVNLMYSRPDNFTGRILYDDLREAYLHPKAARALAKAQKRLKELHPELTLIIFDATRPMSVQQKMWDVVKNTSKDIYVSNPARGGGMHNYGMAVDISICRVGGNIPDAIDTIPMGATVDFMGDLAHTNHEDQLVANHRMTEEARANRELLREVMAVDGFKVLRTEWWHFNLCTREEAKRHYKAIQ